MDLVSLHLPPAEPPDDRTADVLEMVRKIRGYLDDARRQVHMLEQAVRDHADSPTRAALADLTYYAVELELARKRVTWWERNLAAAESGARSGGVVLP